MSPRPLARYLPILGWGRRYDCGALSSDLIAAVIVTVMLVPRSLAYAMLAGLPPETGIYASSAPLLFYAVFGTSRADFAAVAAAILVTLTFRVELGVTAGVLLSITAHLYRTSRPHIAEVGLVPGTQHFRNIRRHQVQTDPAVLALRADESLYFANARFLENWVLRRIAEAPVRHVVLMCSAVNQIDFSALETLEALNHRLPDVGIALHLSDVKGPVMDRLQETEFLRNLSGRVFLCQYDAMRALAEPRAEAGE